MNIQNTVALGREEKKSHANPMLRKLSEVKASDKEVSTYAGIFNKFAYFMLMTIVGIALALVFQKIGFLGIEAGTHEFIINQYSAIGLLASAVMFLVFPLLAFIIRKTIPVAGALYSVSIGYLLGFVMTLGSEMNGYILLATIVTFSLVFVMGFLYIKGKIRVTEKFRLIIMTVFTTMVISGSALLISYFIPGLRDSVLMLRSNPVISIAASVGGVIIASLFLLIDFETIRETVENRLPKEYEWFAAFSVFFTVVWLYLKVLDLIIKIKDANI